MLKWLLAVVVLYGGFVALLYVAQRFVQYFPERRRTAPWAGGLPEAEEACSTPPTASEREQIGLAKALWAIRSARLPKRSAGRSRRSRANVIRQMRIASHGDTP